MSLPEFPTNIKRGLVIGTGYFSRFHLDAWQRLPGVEIVGVCDRDLSKARQAASDFAIADSTDRLAEALNRDDLDFIDIATGPDGRTDLVRQVLMRSLPVICQKPLGHTYVDAEQILQMAAMHPAPFMVHENFRFQPWYREIARIIRSGVIGQHVTTMQMRSRLGDGWGDNAYLSRQPYFRTMPRLLLHETGIHFVDTFRFLLGEVVECRAELQRLNPVIAGEDAGCLWLRFASGATASWDADRYHESLSENPRYTFGELLVEADGGSLWLALDGTLTIKPLGQPAYRHGYAPSTQGFAGDCVLACQQHFLEVIEGRAICETAPLEYARSLRVIEAAYQSHQLQRWVALPSSLEKDRTSGDPTDGIPSGHKRTLQNGNNPPPRRIVDLSLPVSPSMRGVAIDVARRLDSDGWNATTLTLYSHAGTHMDAPRHFLPDGPTLDAQDLSGCVGAARVVDLRPIAPRQLIEVEDLKRAIGYVAPGDRLLLRTDWYKCFGTDAYRDELPRISLALAEWLVAQQVAMIGVEPPSVADVNHLPELTAVHQTLFYGGVLIVEGLANLDQLTQPVVDFIALPLRIMGGDGCPVRAIAIE